MNIRFASPADVDAIRQIERQAATAAHWSEQEYQRLFAAEPRRLTLVADDGELRAFLVARRIGPEWEIENIVVAQVARRRGLGSALLVAFLQLLKQERAESVFLEVRASNAAARDLYQKYGFVESGHRRLYYQHPGEDAVLYRLRLDAAADT